MRSSQAAFNLIVAEEVSSQATYTRKYRRPEWPGEKSGATVGIGYDLGQTAKATVVADWKGRVSDDMIEAMVSACGKTGAAGRTATARIRSSVDIPWDAAIEVHKERVVPRWEARVEAALPNTDKLPSDCFGALLSLTFNRGPAFSNAGPRYAEMRAIKTHMAAEDFGAIPDEFRAMKRLWPDLAGLRKRRDTEAKLFEKGLKQPAVPRPDPVVDEPLIVPTPPPDETVKGNPDIYHVQRRLKFLNYNPGGLDGLWGGLTGGAIAGYINDRGLAVEAPTSFAMFEKIHDALTADLSKAEAAGFTRPIAIERSAATPAELAPKLPEVKAAAEAERLGFWASIAGFFSAIVTAIGSFLGDAIEWLNKLKELAGDLPAWFWVVGALIISGALYYISRKSGDAKNEAVKAFQEGVRS